MLQKNENAQLPSFQRKGYVFGLNVCPSNKSFTSLDQQMQNAYIDEVFRLHIPAGPSNRDSLSSHTTTSPGVRRGREIRATSVYPDYREKSLDRGSTSTTLRLFKYSAPIFFLLFNERG